MLLRQVDERNLARLQRWCSTTDPRQSCRAMRNWRSEASFPVPEVDSPSRERYGSGARGAGIGHEGLKPALCWAKRCSGGGRSGRHRVARRRMAVAGRRTFDGESVADVLAAVMTREPDLASLPVVTPERVAWVIRRCLQKDPRRRLRDIGDALAEERPPQARLRRRRRHQLRHHELREPCPGLWPRLACFSGWRQFSLVAGTHHRRSPGWYRSR